jgi:hypothetical protein
LLRKGVGHPLRHLGNKNRGDWVGHLPPEESGTKAIRFPSRNT